MKKKTLLFISLVLIVSGAAAQTTSKNDADELARQVSRLYAARKFAEALPIAKKAVELRRSFLGESDLKTGESVRALGYVQLALGKSSDARRSLESAIRVYLTVTDLPKQSRDELGMMFERLGLIRYQNGDDSGAVESFTAAVEQRERVFGPDAAEVGQALWSLASVQYFRKEFKKAEDGFWRVLGIRAKQFGYGSLEVEEAEIRCTCAAAKIGKKDEMNARLRAFREQAPRSESISRVIHGGILNGKAINLERPEFPVSARNAVPSGAVTVRITIDEDGKVGFACAISGDRVFWDVSEKAAYRSTFKPTTLEGRPVKVLGQLVYSFGY